MTRSAAWRVWATALALAVAVSGAGRANAFCRTTTCTDCPRDPPTGCTIGGTPIAWPDACLSFSVNRLAAPGIDLAGATALMAEAFATWESARCSDDGAGPSISVSPTFGPALCATPEYNPHGGNANLLIFRSERWPYTSKGHELAATRLTVDDEGVIYDADIEINAATATLTLPGETSAEMSEEVAYRVIPGSYDLLSILIHEAGHFLGLDHSREENSLMLAELDPGRARTQLTPDDVAAICTIYPPDRSAPACDPSPRGGFASPCDDTPLVGGCSVSTPAAGSGGSGGLLLLAALGVASRIGRSRR